MFQILLQVIDFHWNSSNLIYLGEYEKNALNQKWMREENEIISLGVQDQADHSQCLDLYGGSVVNGAVVGIYWRHGGLNQLWTTNVSGTVTRINFRVQAKSRDIWELGLNIFLGIQVPTMAKDPRALVQCLRCTFPGFSISRRETGN